MVTNLTDKVNRDQIDDKFKWQLKDLYASDKEWKRKKAELAAEIEKIVASKGTLSQSAESLFKGLDMITSTGKNFDPFNPNPDDIDIEDIARGLSRVCRFAGQLKPSKEFYSVAILAWCFN